MTPLTKRPLPSSPNGPRTFAKKIEYLIKHTRANSGCPFPDKSVILRSLYKRAGKAGAVPGLAPAVVSEHSLPEALCGWPHLAGAAPLERGDTRLTGCAPAHQTITG